MNNSKIAGVKKKKEPILLGKFNFKNKPVSAKAISKWHEEVLEILQGKNETHCLMASGSSMVLGIKDDDGTISIFEIRTGYKSFDYILAYKNLINGK